MYAQDDAIGGSDSGSSLRRPVVRLLLAVAVIAILVIGLIVIPRPNGSSLELPELGQLLPGPQPVDGRLGLHVTEDELTEWRRRSGIGPYRVTSDVSRNSPGDWTRITEQADEFMRDPERSRWTGPVGNNPGGCVERSPNKADNMRYVPPFRLASELRDAAFVAMVQERDEYASVVKAELLAQIAEPEVDFADKQRWCPDAIDGDNNPIFNIANWLTRLLFAYDYLRIADPELFSAEEQRRLDAWFVEGAEWMQEPVDRKLDEMFVDRDGGDYTLTPVGQDSYSKVLYLGGPSLRTVARRFNNRSGAAARYIALAGVHGDDEDLVDTGKAFVKDTLRFSYYPEGVLGEFERWTEEEPGLGWKYGMQLTGSLLTIADTLARAGDPSLTEFSTTEGALGTEGRHHSGAEKSLATLVDDMASYADGTYIRYGTDDPSHEGDPAYRIGTVDGRSGREFIHDTFLVVGSRWLPNDHVGAVAARTASGVPPYPESPSSGQGDPAGGEWGIYPGVLFMFRAPQ